MHELIRDRGIIYHQIGKLQLAVQHYERYLVVAPDAPDSEAVKTHLQAAARTLARMN